MADFLNIRLTKDSPTLEQIDAAAAKYGKNRTEFVLEAVNMLMSFDNGFYQRVDRYSKALKIPTWLVMQNSLLKVFADKAAKQAIYGELGEVLSEFTFTDQGPLTGEELYSEIYESAYKRYGQEYADNLRQNEIKHKRPLDEHQKKIWEEFGV